VLTPFGWLALGACSVSALYGAIGVLLGSLLPQLSTDKLDSGMPVRLVQSSVVFTLIGIALLWLGFAAAGLLPDPLARVEQRHPRARVLVMGVLIGLFLVGRPYGLFFRMFRYAADDGNPAFGALAFVLQSLGNITIMAVLLIGVQLLSRGRFGAWLTASAARIAAVTAGSLLIAGSFTVLYWGVRVPDMFGAFGGWWPVMPWNG
jgi:sulfite exporter TauE/SafE